MDQFNSHSKSTVFWPSIFLVHFILFRIHEIGKEKKRLEMSSFEECSTIYSWFFSTYMYMYLPLSSRERRLGTRPAVHVLQTRLRRFSPGEKHVDKNFSCASFDKDIANWENWGAYHLTENFGKSGWKVNGKVTFRKFQPKIEEYVLR